MSGLAILGAGAFGTALAVAWGQGREVVLWGRRGAGEGAERLPGVVLPPGVHRSTDFAEAAAAETVVIALPAQALRGFLAERGAALGGRRLVACGKGMDLATGLGPTALIAAACPGAVAAMLSGPGFAADIAAGLPTALTIGCAEDASGAALQADLATPTLRLYRTTDVAGVELGGALKNVVAIAAGVVAGAGLGESARAAVVTRGFAEMARLAAGLGARPETLAGLSGLGDLILTCTSPRSRNYAHGLALGAGRPPAAGVTVEGLATARAALALGRAQGVELPVAECVAALAGGTMTVEDSVRALMSRPLRPE